jgi:Pyridoxamine 5'-phosphate oxidase
LATQGNAILATIDEDGSPHLTEVLFLLDEDDRVLLPTPHSTRKLRNVLARPIATVFFYEQPGWISCTGAAHVLDGEEAAEANQRNRDRVLTAAGHETMGRLLAEHEDNTIVVSPSRWLSWNSDAVVPEIVRLGGDVEAHPPETWFKDLTAD